MKIVSISKNVAFVLLFSLIISCGHKEEKKLEDDKILSTEVMTKEIQTKMTPAQALQKLKDGNGRFLDGISTERDYRYQIQKTEKGQFPSTVILSCIDSRTSSEIIFDQGIGDVFNVRIAGNFATPEIIGSIEYGCKVAGSKLVVVIGHNHCGGVKGTCDNVQLGNIGAIVKEIQPALAFVKTAPGEERTSKNHDFVEAVAKVNVQLTVKELLEKSDILRELKQSGQIDVVGALYDIETGRVEFINPADPIEKNLEVNKEEGGHKAEPAKEEHKPEPAKEEHKKH